LAILGILFCVGFILGVAVSHVEKGGGPMSLRAMGLLAGAVIILILIVIFAFRPIKTLVTPHPDLSTRERLNRNILIGSSVLGAVTGVALSMFSESKGNEHFATFSSQPISVMASVTLAVLWGIIMPVLAYFWHKTVDEQEAYAYREGAYYAFYAYACGAPTWWILWRGGLAPEPNGVVFYSILMTICGAVWFWKRYR
jgi:hypothetical protein